MSIVWHEAFEQTAQILDLRPDQIVISPFPTSTNLSIESHPHPPIQDDPELAITRDKRKSTDRTEENGDVSKKPKPNETVEPTSSTKESDPKSTESTQATNPQLDGQAATILHFNSVLDANDLKPPPVPSTEQWEKLIMRYVVLILPVFFFQTSSCFLMGLG